MADIQRVGVQSASLRPARACPVPAGTVDGDTIVALVPIVKAVETVYPPVAPDGWDPVADVVHAPGQYKVGVWAFVRTADDEPASWLFTSPNLTNTYSAQVILVTYRGALGEITLIDELADDDGVLDGITTTQAGTRLLMVGAAFSPAWAYTLTRPAGTEPLWSDKYVVVADEVWDTVGATGSRTFGNPSAGLPAAACAGLLLGVEPGNRAPLAPTGLTSGVRDFSAAWSFSYVFQDPDAGDTQSARQIRRKVGAGAYEYWDGDSWESTDTWVETSSTTIAFDGGDWTNGTTYDVSVRTKDLDGEEGPWAANVTLGGSTPPTVVVDDLGAVETLRPTLTWAYSDSEADEQDQYEAKVFTEAQASAGGFDPDTSTPVWRSGVSSGDDVSIQVGTALENETAHRGYVRAAQVGGLWSAWDYGTFTTDVDPPGTPTIVVTAHVDEARVEIDVTGDDDTYTDVSFEVERSDDGGVTWALVRGGGALTPDGDQVASLDDWEVPPHTTVLYRATAWTVEPGERVEAVSAAASAILELPTFWLIDPSEPGDSMELLVEYQPVVTPWEEDQAEFRPIGRPDPVVLSAAIRLRRVQMQLLFLTRADFDDFVTLRSKQRTLLLQMPWPEQHYVRVGPALAPSTEPYGEHVLEPVIRVPVEFIGVAKP